MEGKLIEGKLMEGKCDVGAAETAAEADAEIDTCTLTPAPSDGLTLGKLGIESVGTEVSNVGVDG